MTQTVLLHIGYAKTGTSLLQQRVFPQLTGVTYLGRTGHDRRSWWKRWKSAIVGRRTESAHLCGSLEYWTPAGGPLHRLPLCHRQPDLIPNVRSVLHDWVGTQSPVLVSHENILRPGLTDGLADSIREVFREFTVRILVTIREQAQVIWSRYSHDLSVTGFRYTLQQAVAEDAPEYCLAPMCRAEHQTCLCEAAGIRPIPLSYYDYNLLYERFVSVFGKDAVSILPLELMNETPEVALQHILEFSAAEAPADLCQQLTQRINVRSSDRRQAAEQATPEWESLLQSFRGRYAASNLRLQQQTGLPLDELGYCVTSRPEAANDVTNPTTIT